MKKNLEVTMTFDVELDINENMLTPDAIENFESYMFDIDGDPDELFKYVASQFAQQDDPSFVEGIGKCVWKHTSASNDATVLYEVTNLDVVSEIKS